MATTQSPPLLFVVEWFDPLPRLKKRYLMKYWSHGHAIEIIDLKSKKLFLKKSPAPSELTSQDFIIGAKLLLYSREMEIVDYGDGTTRKTLSYQAQSTILILPPETYPSWGKIIDSTTKSSSSSNLNIAKLKSIAMSQVVSDNVCMILGVNVRSSISSALASGVSLVVCLSGEDGITKGDEMAKTLNSNLSVNILSCSNGQEVTDLSNLLFDNKNSNNSSTLDSCTCCIIKPHAVRSKNVGQIISIILQQGYEISAIVSLNMNKSQAEEFLEVYKGVIPDYPEHVIQLCSGLSVALEIRAEDAVETFRQTAGPWDVEMAKELRPASIRGVYGEDKVRSAIHCTDLPVDAVAECEYCFRILQ